MRKPTLLPVIDVRGGVVVHAVAGQRAEYRPIRSQLVASAEPLQVAQALAAQAGGMDLYAADLDALAGEKPQRKVWEQLDAVGFRLWLDAATTSVRRAERLLEGGAACVIVASEALSELDPLEQLVARFGTESLAFSIDLKQGELLARRPLRSLTPGQAAFGAHERGVRKFIVLDVAAVGGAGGPATLDLCRTLRRIGPELELVTGGGVRGPEDVAAFGEAGVDRVLVASALHQGVRFG